MDAKFLEEMARTMTDRDLAIATLSIDPKDQERGKKAQIYIRELSRRDIRQAMYLHQLWKRGNDHEDRPAAGTQ